MAFQEDYLLNSDNKNERFINLNKLHYSMKAYTMTLKDAEAFGMPTTVRQLAKYTADHSDSYRSVGTIRDSILSSFGFQGDLKGFKLNNVPTNKVSQVAEIVRGFYEMLGYQVQPEVVGKDEILKMEYLFRTPSGNKARVSFIEQPTENQRVNLEVAVNNPTWN